MHNSRLILLLVMASPSLLFQDCKEVTKEDMLDSAKMYIKKYSSCMGVPVRPPTFVHERACGDQTFSSNFIILLLRSRTRHRKGNITVEIDVHWLSFACMLINFTWIPMLTLTLPDCSLQLRPFLLEWHYARKNTPNVGLFLLRPFLLTLFDETLSFSTCILISQ